MQSTDGPWPLLLPGRVVPYDDDLADRIRGVVTETHPVTEQKMFGGLAFLVGGNMAIVPLTRRERNVYRYSTGE